MIDMQRSIVFACVRIMHTASSKNKQTFDKNDLDYLLEKYNIYPKNKIKDIILNHFDEIHSFIFKTYGTFNPNKAEEIYSFSSEMFKFLGNLKTID